MAIVKAIAFRVAYYGVALIKLPFTLIVTLSLLIEKFCMWAMVKIAEWGGDSGYAEAVNWAMEATANGMEYWADEYRDLEIES